MYPKALIYVFLVVNYLFCVFMIVLALIEACCPRLLRSKEKAFAELHENQDADILRFGFTSDDTELIELSLGPDNKISKKTSEALIQLSPSSDGKSSKVCQA